MLMLRFSEMVRAPLILALLTYLLPFQEIGETLHRRERTCVHRVDSRSNELAAMGAEIVVGSLEDMTDVRSALFGVQRASFQ